MDPKGSLLCLQEPTTGTYLTQINPVHTTPSDCQVLPCNYLLEMPATGTYHMNACSSLQTLVCHTWCHLLTEMMY
jgi:hypothetical protein